MWVASKAQVLYVHWERHGKDCQVEISGAGRSAVLSGEASIEDALKLLRALPIDSFGRPGRRIARAIAAKDEVLANASKAMKGDDPQGEIVLCALSTREEIAAALHSWRQVVARTV